MAESKSILVKLEVDDSALSDSFKNAQAKAKSLAQISETAARKEQIFRTSMYAKMFDQREKAERKLGLMQIQAAKIDAAMKAKAVKAAEAEAKVRKKSWDNSVKSAKSVAGFIAGATKDVAKWVAYAGSIAGLLAGGSIFGMNRLAAGVADRQRFAAGNLTSQNVVSAAKYNFGQTVDVDSLIGKISAAKIDPTQRHLLAMYGISPNRSVQSILPDLLSKAQSLAKAGGANAAADPRLNQLFSTEDIARLQQDRQLKTEQYNLDIKNLALTERQQQAWIELNQQIERAGGMITNTFVEALTPLAPELTQLSNEIAKAIKAFFDTGIVRGWILSLSAELERFVNWFKSGEYVGTMNSVISTLDSFGGALTGATRVFSSIFGNGFSLSQQNKLNDLTKLVGSTSSNVIKYELSNIIGNLGNTSSEKKAREQANYNLNNIVRTLSPETGAKVLGISRDIVNISRGSYNYVSPAGRAAAANSYLKGISNYQSAFAAADTKYGLPEGTLAAIAMQESRGNPSAVSPKGALGLLQFKPSTAKQFGIDPLNPYQSINAAGLYVKQLLAHYRGNMQKALAAYNWGQGAVDKAVSAYGQSWLQHAPAETRSYVPKILLNINSATGADYNTSVHQAGVQP